ncbi:MAG TPA: PAS domain S-box protein [Candidatus Polarisedimenticolia bacterium]|nr:PAS domain S-box protein [Candidatus Polarisedimenticolia bacterium]
MFNQLHILIVDDSEDDAILMARALQQDGLKLVYERVENASQLETALDVRAWDLVLSDYSMPGFSGVDALRLCQKKMFDAPFIIVSGRIGEELAVEMMRAGASDYVMKDDLPRLAPAVTRELRSAHERKIRRQAQLAMAHLAAIVETCDDAIVSQTLGGTILSWNSGAERMFGYSAEDMIGESIENLVPRDHQREISDIRDVIELGQKVERIETVRLRRDGTRIDVSITVSPIKNADGHIHGASIILRDITDRKRQETERLQLIEELTEALKHVKTLNGLLPICASCKKIRNDGGYWEQVETYIRSRSNAEFTHGICPDCVRLLYPEYESIIEDSADHHPHRGAPNAAPPMDYSLSEREEPLEGRQE